MEGIFYYTYPSNVQNIWHVVSHDFQKYLWHLIITPLLLSHQNHSKIFSYSKSFFSFGNGWKSRGLIGWPMNSNWKWPKTHIDCQYLVLPIENKFSMKCSLNVSFLKHSKTLNFLSYQPMRKKESNMWQCHSLGAFESWIIFLEQTDIIIELTDFDLRIIII